MAVKEKAEKATDWYDLICQELDDLRSDVNQFPDEDFEIPPDSKFEFVKEQLKKIKEASGFPAHVPEPIVWLGPESQIGITWEFEQASVDLVFGARKYFARVTKDLVQEPIEPSSVPKALSDLAA